MDGGSDRRVVAAYGDNRRAGGCEVSGDGNDCRFASRCERSGANPVRRYVGGAESRITVLRQHNGDFVLGIDCDPHLAVKWRIGMQPAQPTQRREPPLLFSPRRHGEVARIERLLPVQPRNGAGGLHAPPHPPHSPTPPSTPTPISPSTPTPSS